MKNKILYIIIIVLSLIVLVQITTRCDGKDKTKTTVDTVYITDTIYQPKLDSIEVTKYVTKYLPSVPDTITLDSIIRDTFLVEVPISLYRLDTLLPNDAKVNAELQGFQVEMNSLEVEYPKITETIVQKSKPKRWGVGINAGYGIGANDNKIYASPYIGIGISYNIFSF